MEAPIFRAPKRRKITVKSTEPDPDIDLEVKNGNSVVVKRQIGAKKTGATFSSTTATSRGNTIDQELELVQNSARDEQPPGGLQGRFIGAGSSTQVTNTDRYMTDFVDRAMAEKPRVNTTPPDHDSSDEYTSASETEDPSMATEKANTSSRLVSQPLSEVDLGPNSTSSNFARTAAALTGQPVQEAPLKRPRRRKPRLGRDGQPLRPRTRKGPSMEDLARSALVEQVLHEHGLGTYEGRNSQSKGTGVNEAADEKMAAEFQQQFLETVAERQQRQAQGTRVKKDTGTSDGPRLGGSRSARAKMAAAQSGGSLEMK